MGEKNDLLSAVASDDVVDRVKHLVEYLSCKVFGQVMYRHVTSKTDRVLYFVARAWRTSTLLRISVW